MTPSPAPMPKPHPIARRPGGPALAALVALLAAAGCGTTGSAYGGGSRVEYVPWRGEGRGGHTIALPGDDGLAPERWDGRISERCREVEPLMRVAAMEHQVDVGLIAGIIHVESSFRPDARSRAGARGLMQVMPKIGKRLKCGDLTDPKRNIQCGLTILKRFMARYDDQVIFGLSAYNAGYKVPNEALEANELPSNYRYVEKVLAGRVSYLRYGCGE